MEVPKHEYLSEDEYYEPRSVSRGRSDKTCEFCGRVIPKGTPHEMHHFYPEFDSYPTHTEKTANTNVEYGGKSCSELFMESLN